MTLATGYILQERGAELARIGLVVRGEIRHLHFYAMPGMGATSLLRAGREHLVSEAGDDPVPMYEVRLPPAERAWEEAESSVETGRYLVAARVWQSVGLGEPPRFAECRWFEVLGQALSKVSSSGEAILVLERVDQSQLAVDPNLADAFASAVERSEARIITTSSRTAGVHDQGLAELLRNAEAEPQFLMPLSDEGTREVVSVKCPSLDESTAAWICERTGGWPALVVRACGLVLDERFAKMNEEEWDARLEMASQSLFARVYAALTEQERDSMLWLCASESLSEHERANDSVVRSLQSKGLIVRRADGFRFVSELLQAYVAPERSLGMVVFHVVEQLQPMQLRLYRCLLEEVNQHVPWRKLCRAAWGTGVEKSKEDLRPQMSYLRKALVCADRGSGLAGTVPTGQADSYALVIRDQEWAQALREKLAGLSLA